MRHIPEEELHSYLDQALSRSQCVEIECHLANCIRCRHGRDQIAAVRDRTTALLGELGPMPRRRPAFAELMLQANGRRAALIREPAGSNRRMAWSRRGVQAAGVALAIAAGWSARGLVPTGPNTSPGTLQQLASGPGLDGFGSRQPLLSSFLPTGPQPSQQVAQPVNSEPDPGWTPDPIERAAPRRVAGPEEVSVAPMVLTVSTLEAKDYGAEFPAPGVWRSVSWTEASALTGDAVPRIQGLPVVEIQVQRLGPDERPLLMVAHQDPSGRIIRSIEGPADRLSELLSEVIDRTDGAVRTSQPLRTTPDYISGATGTPRRSIRVVTIAGRLEADSLNVLTKSLTVR